MSESVGDGRVGSGKSAAADNDGFVAGLLSLLPSAQRKNSQRIPKSTVHAGKTFELRH